MDQKPACQGQAQWVAGRVKGLNPFGVTENLPLTLLCKRFFYRTNAERNLYFPISEKQPATT
jgi:hypothetical protein